MFHVPALYNVIARFFMKHGNVM